MCESEGETGNSKHNVGVRVRTLVRDEGLGLMGFRGWGLGVRDVRLVVGGWGSGTGV